MWKSAQVFCQRSKKLLEKKFGGTFNQRWWEQCSQFADIENAFVGNHGVCIPFVQMYDPFTADRARASFAFDGNTIVVRVVLFGYRSLAMVGAYKWGLPDMQRDIILIFTD